MKRNQERASPRCIVAVPVYRRHMPGRKRPTDQDAAVARRALLDGLARDAGIFEVLSGLAPLHPRNNTFPGEVFLHRPRTRWSGAEPAGPSRWPWRDCASGSCPSAPSADGRTPSCSTQLPTSAPPRAGRASRSGRHARTSTSAPATRVPADSARPGTNSARMADAAQIRLFCAAQPPCDHHVQAVPSRQGGRPRIGSSAWPATFGEIADSECAC